MKRVWTIVAAALLFACAVTPAISEELAAPDGKVVLTVSGKIARTNAIGAARLDLSQILALPSTTFKTTTQWTQGETTFTGIRFADLLYFLQADGESVKFIALNKYYAQGDLKAIAAAGGLLAYKMNGEWMSIRDKGPLWLVFPYDTDAALQTDEFWRLSVWQLSVIEID